MTIDGREILLELKPVRAEPVMDLVSAAGISVARWSVKQDGSPVATPRANPQFCYEWSFGIGDEPRALCVWHEDLKIIDGRIAYAGNMKRYAADLDQISREKFRSPDVRNRARQQSKRAGEFDYTLQRAARRNEPLRVILLTSETRSAQTGRDASKVATRSLDSPPWIVRRYSDDDGSFVLERTEEAVSIPSGSPGSTPEDLQASWNAAENKQNYGGARPSTEMASPPEAGTSLQLIDQFDRPSEDRTRDATGQFYIRDARMRQFVLRRSGGKCELCHQIGFVTASGAIYLETHHVVPLSEGGSDTPDNMLALCPNDHRRAHYAAGSSAIRDELLKLVHRLDSEHSEVTE